MTHWGYFSAMSEMTIRFRLNRIMMLYIIWYFNSCLFEVSFVLSLYAFFLLFFSVFFDIVFNEICVFICMCCWNWLIVYLTGERQNLINIAEGKKQSVILAAEGVNFFHLINKVKNTFFLLSDHKCSFFLLTWIRYITSSDCNKW